MSAKSSLPRIERAIRKIQAAAVKRSTLWLVGLSAVILLALAGASRLQTLLSIDELIDSDFRAYAPLVQLKETFNDKNDLLLVVSGPNRAPNRKELCAIQKWLLDEVDGNYRFRRIVSVYGIRKPKMIDGGLKIPPVLDLPCATDTPEADAKVASQLAELRDSPWGRILTSRSGDDVALSFYLNDTAKDLRFGAFDVGIVAEIEKSFDEKVVAKFPGLRARWAGVAPHQYYLKEGLDQTNLLNLAMPVLVCFLFWLFFANARTGILFVVTIAIGGILVYGAMAVFHAPVDVLANTLLLMIMLSSLEDFLFLVHHHQDGERPWREAFRRLLLPGFFTSLTTAVGFASLGMSNLATIRRFGAFAAFAAMVEWALVFIFLPAFLDRFPHFRSWLVPRFSERGRLHGFLSRLARFRLPRAVGFALLAVYAASGYGLTRLRVSDAPANIFPAHHPVSEALEYLKESRGWESQVSLVFANYYREKENRAVENAVEKLPNVVALESPYRIEDYLVADLPADETDRMHRFWKEAPAAARFVGADNSARTLVYLLKTDTASIDALSSEVTRLCPSGECHLAGTLVAYTEFGDRVLATLLESLGVSLFLVSIVVVYLLRAKGNSAYFSTLLSLMWGPFALICIFWLFDFPVTYVTCTFASIVVGIAGDNTIQYLFGTRRGTIEGGVERQGRASVLVTLMMMGLSVLFYGSYFASVRSLATLFILGFALTLVGDLWIFKGILPKAEDTPRA
ncbi:MAG: hypothetical protein JST04_18195 [Bdellovibrionales bacterium]|nr:hypothetical protein [Bdellovibrionales bacterium]